MFEYADHYVHKKQVQYGIIAQITHETIYKLLKPISSEWICRYNNTTVRVEGLSHDEKIQLLMKKQSIINHIHKLLLSRFNLSMKITDIKTS